jgi:hypothetical protein
MKLDRAGSLALAEMRVTSAMLGRTTSPGAAAITSYMANYDKRQ